MPRRETWVTDFWSLAMFHIGSNVIVVTNLVPLVGEQKKGAKLFVSHSGLQIMFAYESFMHSAHA